MERGQLPAPAHTSVRQRHTPVGLQVGGTYVGQSTLFLPPW